MRLVGILAIATLFLACAMVNLVAADDEEVASPKRLSMLLSIGGASFQLDKIDRTLAAHDESFTHNYRQALAGFEVDYDVLTHFAELTSGVDLKGDLRYWLTDNFMLQGFIEHFYSRTGITARGVRYEARTSATLAGGTLYYRLPFRFYGIDSRCGFGGGYTLTTKLKMDVVSSTVEAGGITSEKQIFEWNGQNGPELHVTLGAERMIYKDWLALDFEVGYRSLKIDEFQAPAQHREIAEAYPGSAWGGELEYAHVLTVVEYDIGDEVWLDVEPTSEKLTADFSGVSITGGLRFYLF